MISIVVRKFKIISVLKEDVSQDKLLALCNYASEALKSQNNESVLRVGLEAVGDLVRNFNELMTPFVHDLITYMIDILSSPELQRNLRPVVF